MVDLKRTSEFASIGRDFISLQFRLTPDDATRSIDQLWVLGYCYGVLDAVRQSSHWIIEACERAPVGEPTSTSDLDRREQP